ncbi:MAG: SulP family inorganic anion transporter [Candidatus Melainabacteria bacterium]|nr:SulP family inorganic anion transporter [Candidatus Melainabacteria bacterium]
MIEHSSAIFTVPHPLFQHIKPYFNAPFRRDLLASVVVFLVALPLALGTAIASGLPPLMGIISSIIGGILVGVFAGCSLQVSGAAAGLITITADAVHRFGLENLGFLLLMAGLLQMGFGMLRLGHWFRAVSPAVIQGMLSGIGVMIFASQFHVMLDNTPKQHPIENLLAIPQALWQAYPNLWQDLNGTSAASLGATGIHTDGNPHIAAAIGVLTIGTVCLWNGTPRRLTRIPGMLVGVLVAIAVAYAFQLPIRYITLPTADLALLWQLHWPSWPQISLLNNTSFVVTAVTMAFIASTETLLTATAVDQLRPGHRTLYNQELLAQGLGNALAGLLGALPITGVMVRSAANVEAGAATRVASMLHGLWLLLFMVFLPALLKLIPIASLAAVLVYTGYKLFKPSAVRELLPYGRSEVAIFLLTVTAILLTNLLEGILVGVGLSMAKLLYRLNDLKLTLMLDSPSQLAQLSLQGSATFVNLPRLATELERVPAHYTLHINLEKLTYIDHAGLNLLMKTKHAQEQAGGEVILEWNILADKFAETSHSARLTADDLDRPPTEGH